jgi:methionyl-tRNA formyltransferase
VELPLCSARLKLAIASPELRYLQLDAGMDTGPIYLSAQIPLSVSTTADQLFESLANLGVEPVLKTLDLIERGESTISARGERSD